MPEFTVDVLLAGMAKLNLDPTKTTVALLGLAYKKNIDDLRESPALEIKKIMAERHIPVRVFDPMPQIIDRGDAR